MTGVAVAAALAGCGKDNAGTHHYDNKAFISASALTEQILVETETDSYTRELTIGIASPEDHDVSATFRTAPELLDTYRKAYYDNNAELLPEGICTIENPVASIVSGTVESTPVTLEFSNTGTLDLDKRYVLPVTVSEVSGIDFLESKKTFYYIFRGASIINMVGDLSENRAWPEWGSFEQVRNMSAFTMEALVYPNALDKQISTIMGIENTFLLRFGDSGISPNQLQVVGPYGNQKVTNNDMRVPVGEWTHIAVTFDDGAVAVYINGEKKAESTFSGRSVNFAVPHSNESGTSIVRCFWVGYSFEDARYFDGRFSELRMWNRALTEEEINAPDHFYRVANDSEGLVAYWKFDDGTGKIAEDYSQYGNDLTIESEPEWVSVAIPERGL